MQKQALDQSFVSHSYHFQHSDHVTCLHFRIMPTFISIEDQAISITTEETGETNVITSPPGCSCSATRLYNELTDVLNNVKLANELLQTVQLLHKTQCLVPFIKLSNLTYV